MLGSASHRAGTLPLCMGWQRCPSPAAPPGTAVVAAERVQGPPWRVTTECTEALGSNADGAPIHCIPGLCYSPVADTAASLGCATAPSRTPLHPWDVLQPCPRHC